MSTKLFAEKNLRDTFQLSLPEAEKIFIQNNLLLLTSKYDVDVAKLEVLDSKLWYNPEVSYSQEFYNHDSKKYFLSKDQVDVQVSQLISIAGKHTNTVKLARLNNEKAEWQFKEILRGLKFELWSRYSALSSAQQKQRLFDYEVEKLRALMQGEQQKLALGAISKNDVLRLQTEINDLVNDALLNYDELESAEQDLNVLLNLDEPTFIVTKDNSTSAASVPVLASLIETAEKNRPDLQLLETDISYLKQNIKLQRSLAVPDLQFTGEYDKASSFTRNYTGIGVALPLPIFNRNQHQIGIAKTLLDQSLMNDSMQENVVRNEVTNAYFSFQKVNDSFKSNNGDFENSLNEMNQYALENYSKHNINLIDFLDQVRTYTQSKLKIIDLKEQLNIAKHTINFVTSSQIIK